MEDTMKDKVTVKTMALAIASLAAGFAGLVMLFGECGSLVMEVIDKVAGVACFGISFSLWPFGGDIPEEEKSGKPDGWMED